MFFNQIDTTVVFSQKSIHIEKIRRTLSDSRTAKPTRCTWKGLIAHTIELTQLKLFEGVMPIYEYRCPSCRKGKEVFQKHTDPGPVCKPCKVKMEKLVSLSSFMLEGEGWAKDNYGLKKAE
jgi:putative FmdB family regulatory protein